MNIVLPFAPANRKVPVMVYVHGGSLMYGGANFSIFDAVNLVSQSVEMKMPIICVNFNYRVGLGGFVANEALSVNFRTTDSRVCMSGLSVSIPPWIMEQHEKQFQAVSQYFQIDLSASGALNCLRRSPRQELANATSGFQGVLSGTGNPCRDVFKIPNYATARASRRLGEPRRGAGALFLYHFDQRSRLKNALQETAYHAHELLYLFINLTKEMNSEEKAMANDFAAAWIRFTNGQKPWVAADEAWKIWEQNSAQATGNEEEDEQVRSYTRVQRFLAMGEGRTWMKWLDGVDALVNERMNLGKTERVSGSI
ncbi:uncharacterized protein ACLA_086680 [Aspergillus clavatus NRRL 1]|uniref:Carboxylesterase type B domain-containing protein n=1 Tax=Aspergillus clavatus (strain ATCC 1007 / CBS 513.65 / DSM 816 / NCTC 3887 / NRRL 1 / QM 1276 / 107) TaxID=344612 RepID=A1CUI0_ASPCL|nr:uncharacterized protein ACLA_086680 [Aspergillus clavatus NRRL 1]EAW06967.1 hypothetical protein ACLA_086680 [Aspergillus clavatus NRRL 1]